MEKKERGLSMLVCRDKKKATEDEVKGTGYIQNVENLCRYGKEIRGLIL